MMGKKISMLACLVLALLFAGSVYITIDKFNEIKNQYKSIEPNLDNYSTAEILFLAFERTRTAAYHSTKPDEFITKKSVFDSKVQILKNKSIRTDSFYYEPDFLQSLDRLQKQSHELNELFLSSPPESRQSLTLRKMDEIQPTLIDLQEIIYRIQIKNFNSIKSIILDNSSYAEATALFGIFMLFSMIILLWIHISRLNAAIKGKNVFISAIYHELSGSIQKIQLSSDMIDVRGDPIKAESYLAKISYHSNKLYHQTKEILEFSKIEIGNVGLKNSTFYLQDILDESLSLFNEQKSNKLHCRTQPAEQLINADKQKLVSIIHNLTDNSNKNTENGIINVNLRVYKKTLIIRVTDTGCGFDMSKLHLLFQPFNQGAEDQTKQGLGLGLTIIKSYIKTMNGSINAYSQINRGSRFTVKIPVTLIDD